LCLSFLSLLCLFHLPAAFACACPSLPSTSASSLPFLYRRRAGGNGVWLHAPSRPHWAKATRAAVYLRMAVRRAAPLALDGARLHHLLNICLRFWWRRRERNEPLPAGSTATGSATCRAPHCCRLQLPAALCCRYLGALRGVQGAVCGRTEQTCAGGGTRLSERHCLPIPCLLSPLLAAAFLAACLPALWPHMPSRVTAAKTSNAACRPISIHALGLKTFIHLIYFFSYMHSLPLPTCFLFVLYLSPLLLGGGGLLPLPLSANSASSLLLPAESFCLGRRKTYLSLLHLCFYLRSAVFYAVATA